MTKASEVRISDAEIVEMIVRHLAEVRAVPLPAIQRELEQGGGNLEIDSKQGQVVAILVEIELDREGMIRIEDQVSDNLTSVSSLQRLISRRLAGHRGGG
jgi:hypothetical protein